MINVLRKMNRYATLSLPPACWLVDPVALRLRGRVRITETGSHRASSISSAMAGFTRQRQFSRQRRIVRNDRGFQRCCRSYMMALNHLPHAKRHSEEFVPSPTNLRNTAAASNQRLIPSAHIRYIFHHGKRHRADKSPHQRERVRQS